MAEDRGAPARRSTSGKPAQTLIDNGFGPDDLRRAREVLEAVVSDRALLALLPDEERTRLLVAAGRTVHPDLQQKRRLVRSLRAAKKRKAEARDRSVLAGTGIRAARQTDGLRGPAAAAGSGRAGERARGRDPEDLLRLQGRVPPGALLLRRAVPRLRRAQLREALPDRRPARAASALVTGARVKIGYQAALKLLRAGATWSRTTRFPHDAARRYATEPDFARVERPAPDPRPRPAPLAERRDLLQPAGPRPRPARPARQQRLPDRAAAARLLRAPPRVRGARRARRCLPSCGRSSRGTTTAVRLLRGGVARDGRAVARAFGGLVAWRGGGAGLGLRHSARLSQVGFDFDEAARREDLFPAGALDADLQQVDLRARELLAAHARRGHDAGDDRGPARERGGALHPVRAAQAADAAHAGPRQARRERLGDGGRLLARHQDRPPPAHEHGQGGAQHADAHRRPRLREGRHPHERRRHRLDHRRGPVRARRRARSEELGFQPPLDIVDGAARVLDPFLAGLNSGEHAYGKFFKDYQPSNW